MLLHPNHAGMQTDAVAALGNMALRMPANCSAIAEAGGLIAVANAFMQHLVRARTSNPWRRGFACWRSRGGVLFCCKRHYGPLAHNIFQIVHAHGVRLPLKVGWVSFPSARCVMGMRSIARRVVLRRRRGCY